MPTPSDDGNDCIQLEQLVTPQRLAPYLAFARQDLKLAFELYDWNVEVSAAVLAVAARVEIILRNTLDRQMQAWGTAHGFVDWMDGAPLDRRGLQDIQEARRRTSRYGANATHGHRVAELSLGFWRYLCGKRYLASLWAPHLVQAFPFATGNARVIRAQVESDVQQLLFLRNRAAHHEPIHWRDLISDLAQVLRLVAAIDPVAEQWVRNRERITEIVAQRPMH